MDSMSGCHGLMRGPQSYQSMLLLSAIQRQIREEEERKEKREEEMNLYGNGVPSLVSIAGHAAASYIVEGHVRGEIDVVLLPPEIQPYVQRWMEKSPQKKVLRSVRLWSEKGHLNLSATYNSQQKKNGICCKWHDNGQIWLYEEYMDGVLHGRMMWWDEMGKLWSQQLFEMGKRHGECEWYNKEHGSLEKTSAYVHGQLHGPTRHYRGPDRHLVAEYLYNHGQVVNFTKRSKWETVLASSGDDTDPDPDYFEESETSSGAGDPDAGPSA